jgi:hypothetical protein
MLSTTGPSVATIFVFLRMPSRYRDLSTHK